MATRTISTKIAIDGENEYRRSIANINNSLKTLQSELSKVESEYQGNANSLEALSAKKKALSDIQEKETAKVKELKAALENAKKAQQQHASAYAEYSNKISNAEQRLAELESTTGDTAEEQEKLTREIEEYKKAQAESQAKQEAATKGVEDWQRKLNLAERDLNNVKSEIGETNKRIGEMTDKLKNLTSGLGKASENLNNMGNRLTMGLTAPLIAAGTAAVNYASDTDESLNKTEVAFGVAAESVNEWSKTTLTSFGLARGTALDMAALYGDMATAMGYGKKEAAEMSTTLVGLAADLASFKNISVDTAANALKSIFTGETETLKNLGVVMTETNLKSYALAQGFKTAYSEMDQAEKVALRYQYVMAMTENAQGDFERTADGTANQLRILKESLKEAAATAGNHLLPIITPIIQKLSELIQTFSSLDEETQKTVVKTGLFLATLGPALKLTGGLTSVITSAVSAYQALKAAQTGAAAAQTTLNVTMSANPIGAVVTAIGALIAALGSLAAVNTLAGDRQENLNKQLKETEEIRLEAIEQANDEQANTLGMISALEDLAAQENKTEAQKQAILTLVEDLNEAVPNLTLAYDEQTDSLNMTVQAVRELAQAEALRATQQANIDAIAEKYTIIAKAEKTAAEAGAELVTIQNDLSRTVAESEKQIDSFGTVTPEMANEIDFLHQREIELNDIIQESNETITEAQREIDALSGDYEYYNKVLEDAADQTDAQTEAQENAVASAEELEESTIGLCNAVDNLTSALDEQTQSGSLNLDTALELINTGYAAALAIDEESGAITVNKAAYIELTQAKIEEQIASVEAARAAAVAAEAQNTDRYAALENAGAYYKLAEAKAAAQDEIKSYDAQIAALEKLKNAVGNYSYTAETANKKRTASARTAAKQTEKVRTQAEQDLERFKELQADLQYQRDMDQISEEEYYKKLAEYRDQYLTDDANIDEYRRINKEIYKYDKELAEEENKLWEEQTENLIDELQGRLDEVVGKQEEMAGKLSDYGGLFEIDEDRMSLNSLQDQIDVMDEYADTLDRLKEAGIDDGLLNEIVAMDVDDAVAYGKKLLGMSPEELEAYNNLWKEKQEKAIEISSRFYAEELRTIEEEYNEKLGESLGTLKETAFESGQETAQGLIEGLSEKEQAIYAKARAIANEVSRLLSAAGEASASGIDGSHAGGLSYVPYDGYIAELHRGERVLTAEEAKKYIAASVPQRLELRQTDYGRQNATAIVNGIVGALSQAVSSQQQGIAKIQLVLPNGKMIAEAVYDPLKDLQKQRGD